MRYCHATCQGSGWVSGFSPCVSLFFPCVFPCVCVCVYVCCLCVLGMVSSIWHLFRFSSSTHSLSTPALLPLAVILFSLLSGSRSLSLSLFKHLSYFSRDRLVQLSNTIPPMFSSIFLHQRKPTFQPFHTIFIQPLANNSPCNPSIACLLSATAKPPTHFQPPQPFDSVNPSSLIHLFLCPCLL